MTSPEDNASAVLMELTTFYTDSYCEAAAAALFIYDFVLTIGDESKYFWSNQFTGAAALFYLNRFIAMGLYVLCMIFNSISLSNASCAAGVKLIQAVQLLLYVSPGAFTALRVFALSHKWALAIPTFILSVFPPLAVNMTTFWFGFTGVVLPVPVGCQAVNAVSFELAKTFTIISRTSLIAADCIAIVDTWMNLSSRNTPDAPDDPDEPATPRRHSLDKSNTFAHVLLRDGSIYFVVIGVLNCIHLTFTLLSIEIVVRQRSSVITEFTAPMTAILVSRFLIHLQSVKYKTSNMGSSALQMSSIRFERFIGSLDASLSLEDFLADPDDMEPTAMLEVLDQSRDNNDPLPAELGFTNPDEDETGTVRLESLLEDCRAATVAGPSTA